MKEWRTLARASEVDITTEELERLLPVLDGLESAFRPLIKKIPFGTEGALIFLPARQEEQ